MSNHRKSKSVLLGVCGGIAAYKACEVTRLLRKAHVKVHVLMTPKATNFVSPLTFAALSGCPVGVHDFPPDAGVAGASGSYDPLSHVYRSREADLLLLAPATANTLAKVAAGIADNLLLSTVLAFAGPVIFAPAMNSQMYLSPPTQENIAKLKARGFLEVEPETGDLASLDKGPGRLAEPSRIVQRVLHELNRTEGFLSGRKILVTAGGTREYLDEVRFLTNASSGTLALACADELFLQGAEVEMLATPSVASAELARRAYGITSVVSAEEMQREVQRRASELDVLLMLAAVADYRPPRRKGKAKKEEAAELALKLTRTEDILVSLPSGAPAVRIGVSLEAEDAGERAAKKLTEKNLSAIIAVELSERAMPFGEGPLRAGILTREGWAPAMAMREKTELAREIAHLTINLLKAKEQKS